MDQILLATSAEGTLEEDQNEKFQTYYIDNFSFGLENEGLKSVDLFNHL